MTPAFRRVAVVGTGVIGRSWGAVFMRAGVESRLFDPDPGQLTHAMDWLQALADEWEAKADQATRISLGRVHRCNSLAEALDGVAYVQESGPEAIATKRALFATLDASAAPDVILASSTSAHDMTDIANGLAGANRCVVAHPVNPPHVIPVVEVLPGRATSPDVVDATLAFLTNVGQRPVRMHRYAPGFLINRMQAALVREAISLVESGVADVDAVDTVIRDGLGLRWALFGPFGVANTNADGGIREYLQRYGSAFQAIMNDLGPTPSFEAEMIERVARQTDAAEGGAPVAALIEWRDHSIERIKRMREEHPHPSRPTGEALHGDH